MEIVDKHQHKQRKLVLSPSVKTVDLYGYVPCGVVVKAGHTN